MPPEFKEKKHKLGEIVPTRTWSYEKIRKLLNARLPDLLAKQILNLQNPKKISETIRSVNSAAERIAKAPRYIADPAFRLLRNDKIASLFIKYPDAFVRIAKTTGNNAADSAFISLKNEMVGSLFAKNPNNFIRYYAQIAQAAGDAAGWAFHSLRNDKIASLFIKYPDAFVRIAQATSKYAYSAF